MTEWRSIPDYENYEVSDKGEVRNAKGYILNSCSNSHGYLHVTLYNDEGRASCSIHRLVANAFLPNPEGKPIVHHKDGDKHNNNVTNLEWVTNKENLNYSAHQKWKPICLINEEGVIITSPNRLFFVEELGFDSGCLSRLASGEYSSYKGWRLHE